MLGGRTVRLATLFFLLVGFAFTSTSALSYWREVTVSYDISLVTIGEPVELIIDDLNQNKDVIEKQMKKSTNYKLYLSASTKIDNSFNISLFVISGFSFFRISSIAFL